jgi:hypothetical protein
VKRLIQRTVLAIVLGGTVALTLATWSRIARVNKGAAAIPSYRGAREGASVVRYWPHVLSWDDRSSARVDRVFALSQTTSLLAIARQAQDTLAARGWYLITPDDLRQAAMDPQVIVWQREPDERLDLVQLWPVAGMTPTQRMYGGKFPAEFLKAPQVIGWTWALGGPRSARPALPGPAIVRPPAPPLSPSGQ